MCDSIVMDDPLMSNVDRVRILEEQVATLERMVANNERTIAFNDDNMRVLGRAVGAFDAEFGDDSFWQAFVEMMVGEGHEISDIADLMTAYAGVDEDMFFKTFNVSVTVPVYVTLSVRAINDDDAEEKAQDLLGNTWLRDLIDEYDADFDSFNVSYDHIQEV